MELFGYLFSYSVTWAYMPWTSMQWLIMIWRSGLAEMYLEGIVYSSAKLDLHVSIRQWKFHVNALLFKHVLLRYTAHVIPF